MIRNTFRKLLTLLFFLAAFRSVGFCNEIDSLKALLSQRIADTARVNVLNALSKSYFHDNPDTAVIIAATSRKLAEQIRFESGLALALKNMGIGFYLNGKYVDAIKTWQEAIDVYNRMGDKRGVANMLSNQGAIFSNRGDDAKALELDLQSLKMSEDLSDTLRILTSLNNIGIVYLNKTATYNKALEYFLRSFELSKKINDTYLIGTSTANLGELYFKMKDDDKALYYLKISVKAYEGTEDLPYSLNYIGRVYTRQKEYAQAIKTHRQAYEIAKKLDTKLDQAQSLVGLGQAYSAQGNLAGAIGAFKKALEVAAPLNATTEIKDIYEGLSSCYSQQADFTNAFKYQNLLLAIKDTIYNIETDKKLGGIQFDFDLKKKQSEIDLLSKDKQIQDKVIQKQRIVRNTFIGGFSVVLLFAIVFFRQRNKIGKEKKRSERLLLNILPEETAEELKAKGSAESKLFNEVTVLFTDFKGFTQLSEQLSAKELVSEINECFSAFDMIMEKYGIEKIKTIGDSYMAAGGLPAPNTTHAIDVVYAALEIKKFMEQHKAKKQAAGKLFFEIRIGVNTGPVVAGIVGIKKFSYDIWGDTVNTASRMESSGEVGKVNVSGSTYELIKNRFTCIHRGKITAKGKGEIDMYFVEKEGA